MNLQQIPRGIEYRQAFYHPDGLTICDFSNMEIRRIAELAGELSLIEALNNGLDVHLETAKRMFDLEGKDAKYIKAKRDIGKKLNFSIVYGISAFKLSYDFKVTEKEAQSWIDNFFKAYPKIKKFLDTTRKQCLKTGELKIDKFGRYFYFPQWERYKQLETELERQRRLGLPLNKGLYMEYKRIQGDIEREAGNYIVSGSCATINKIAGIYLYQQGIKQLLAVHDENIVKGDYRAEVVKSMQDAWNILNTSVGMPLEAHYAQNWIK